MKKLLITGGTVFVSRFAATWFSRRGYDVYVLNRGTRPQVEGVKLICADRHESLQKALKGLTFDAVLDICAYHAQDVNLLLDGLESFQDYILTSSSAVYPQTNPQPFTEEQPIGPNAIWGAYGTNKIDAEQTLLARSPSAYILRPPYLYGPMQNVYREPFVFECAQKKRPFYLPKDGSMQLQFFHVEDLCRMMEVILQHHPEQHILNVGNPETVSIADFVRLCYRVVGQMPNFVHVHENVPQRAYFSFHDYEYKLDVTKQAAFLPDTIPLEQGLAESFAWYQEHPHDVVRKDYIQFIDERWNKTDA